jgi:hypothetical protein
MLPTKVAPEAYLPIFAEIPEIIALEGNEKPNPVAFKNCDVEVEVPNPLAVKETVAFELSFAATLVGFVQAVPLPELVPVLGELAPAVNPVKSEHEEVTNRDPEPPAQIDALVTVGEELTPIVIVVVEAHCPAVGVNVYVVVAVLFKAGAHVPVMLLFDVVGSGFNVEPEQIAAT